MLSSKTKRELKIDQRQILIDSIEIGIPSPKQILTWGERLLPNGKKVGLIKNSKTVNYKRFTPFRDGLFCERIFGPVTSFVCACGKKQPHSKVSFCEKCEVEYIDQRARRYRLGYISLLSPVTHIWYLKGRPSYLSLFLGKRKKTVVALAYCNAYLIEHGISRRDDTVKTNRLWPRKQALGVAPQDVPSLQKVSFLQGSLKRKLDYRSESCLERAYRCFPSFSPLGQSKCWSFRNALLKQNFFPKKGLNLSTKRVLTQSYTFTRSQESLDAQNPFLKRNTLKNHSGVTNLKKDKSLQNKRLFRSFRSRKSPPRLQRSLQGRALTGDKHTHIPSLSYKSSYVQNKILYDVSLQSQQLPLQNPVLYRGQPLTSTYKTKFCMQSFVRRFVRKKLYTFKHVRRLVNMCQSLYEEFTSKTQAKSAQKFDPKIVQRLLRHSLFKKDLHPSFERFRHGTRLYTRQHSLPFLPGLVAHFYLRDALLNFIHSSPAYEDLPLVEYCNIERWEPLRDVHKFMAHRTVDNLKNNPSYKVLNSVKSFRKGIEHPSCLRAYKRDKHDNPDLFAELHFKSKQCFFLSDLNKKESGVRGRIGLGLPQQTQPGQRRVETEKHKKKNTRHLESAFLLRNTLVQNRVTLSDNQQKTTLPDENNRSLLSGLELTAIREILSYTGGGALEQLLHQFDQHDLCKFLFAEAEILRVLYETQISAGLISPEKKVPRKVSFLACKASNPSRGVQIFDLSRGGPSVHGFNPPLFLQSTRLVKNNRSLNKALFDNTFLQEQTPTNRKRIKPKNETGFVYSFTPNSSKRQLFLNRQVLGPHNLSCVAPNLRAQFTNSHRSSYRYVLGPYKVRKKIGTRESLFTCPKGTRSFVGKVSKKRTFLRASNSKASRALWASKKFCVQVRQRFINKELPLGKDKNSLLLAKQAHLRGNEGDHKKLCFVRKNIWSLITSLQSQALYATSLRSPSDKLSYLPCPKGRASHGHTKLWNYTLLGGNPIQNFVLEKGLLAYNAKPYVQASRRGVQIFLSTKQSFVYKALCLSRVDFSGHKGGPKSNRVEKHAYKSEICKQHDLRSSQNRYNEQSWAEESAVQMGRCDSAKKSLYDDFQNKQSDLQKKQMLRISRRIYKVARRLKITQLLTRNHRKPEWMILSHLPVLPPDLRPILQMSEKVIVASDLNIMYQRVIYRNNRHLRVRFIDFHLVTAIQRLVQDAVDRLIENGKGGSKPYYTQTGRPLKSLSDTLKGKKGRFRLNLLGKRVDFSGRSVIVVSPLCQIHECGLPKDIALELYHYFLLRQLIVKKHCVSIVTAKKMIRSKSSLMWNILRELMYHHPVLLNRAPTLHRLGIQAFQPKLILGNAIALHPLVCSGFNADFDGDQMGVHLPLSFAARSESWDLLWSRNNLLSPATGQPMLVPSQDMVLGFYYITAQAAQKRREKLSDSDLVMQRDALILRKALHLSSFSSQEEKENKALSEGKNRVIQSITKQLPSLNGIGVLSSKTKRFFSLQEITTALQTGQIELHQPVWLDWNGKLENEEGSCSAEPLELRVHAFGLQQSVYEKYISSTLFTKNRFTVENVGPSQNLESGFSSGVVSGEEIGLRCKTTRLAPPNGYRGLLSKGVKTVLTRQFFKRKEKNVYFSSIYNPSLFSPASGSLKGQEGGTISAEQLENKKSRTALISEKAIQLAGERNLKHLSFFVCAEQKANCVRTTAGRVLMNSLING